MSELSSDDLHAIEDVHSRWLETERAGDTMAVLRLCTDDVVWIPPDYPVLDGKEAISHWLKGAEVEIRRLEVTGLKIGGSGTVAYKTGNYQTLFRSEGRSKVSEAKGTHLWVLKKSARGDWLVAIVTWTCLIEDQTA